MKRQDKAIWHCNRGRLLKEEFEDTKGVIRIRRRILKGQTTQWPKKSDKWTNNDLQNTKQKTKD